MRQCIVMLIVVIIHTLPNIDHVVWPNMATISDCILATNFFLLTLHCIMGKSQTIQYQLNPTSVDGIVVGGSNGARSQTMVVEAHNLRHGLM